MRIVRLVALAALGWSAASAPASAGLVLVAGVGPATLPTNNYGFSGTYYDMKGPNGTSENVAHPGGGPVAYLYVFSNGGGISTYFDSQAGPYDGADDTQVGVLNNSSQSLFSFKVVSNQAVFAFDGDGIDAFPYNSPGNKSDTTGYGGPLTFFTGIGANETRGTVNFVGGLAANGGSTYFTLEEPPTLSAIPTAVPEPSSMLLAGFGLLMAFGHARHRRLAALARSG